MDTGQIVISALLGLIGAISWFIKKDIVTFAKRLDAHDERLIDLTGSVQRLIGYYEATKDRRGSWGRKEKAE